LRTRRTAGLTAECAEVRGVRWSDLTRRAGWPNQTGPE